MSVLREYPDAIINNKDLQVWNNAAFDDSENSNSNNPIKSSSSLPLNKPVFINPSFDSIDYSFSSKENQSPSGLLSKSPVNESKPLKNHLVLSKQSVVLNREKQIDEEIELIENEISRLNSRLDSLRLEKTARNIEKQGRIMDVVKNRDSGVKKIEESGFSRTKNQRRGFSLGPNEIMSAINSKAKPSTTPIQSAQNNRRKSCFWKLQDIEEEKVGFSRGIRQAVTSVGAKKGTKKDDLVLLNVQPKKLFGDKSVPARKPLKAGRVIASRYNQATVNSSMRKRSLPENDDRKLCENDYRVKKKWEIPKRLGLDGNENEGLIVLPRIRAVRCVNDTPRGSGQVKRVADLAGKKSYFGFDNDEEEEEETVCQKLSFEED